MGKYSDNNTSYLRRYDALGRLDYFDIGFTGKTLREDSVAMIDSDFSNTGHGTYMKNTAKYFLPDYNMKVYKIEKNIYSDIITAVKQGCKDGVKIIIMALSGDVDRPDMYKATKEAYEIYDVLLVTSAGNTGNKFRKTDVVKRYPSFYSHVLGILSIDNDLGESDFSSRGSGAVCTFGQNVLSENLEGEEVQISGTSPATFMVGGMLGLELEKYTSENGVEPSAEYLYNFAIENVIDMGVEIGEDINFGHGFFTANAREAKQVFVELLDADKNGLTDRVDEIKLALLQENGLTEEEIDKKYEIVRYELDNGVKIPFYGAKTNWW